MTESDWKVEHGRKCLVFNEWCRENGVIMPKLEYPGYFEGGLIGVRATQPIEYRESLIAVPYKLFLTVDGAIRHPVLGQIIHENPHLFYAEEKGDWELHILILYLIYEHQQGDDSFWKPWIDMMPDVKFFCRWDESEILQTQDADLMQRSHDYKGMI